MVKCWDLETNKVIRHYHGHLSGVYSLACVPLAPLLVPLSLALVEMLTYALARRLHPTLDVLVTAGRDASARVWDMRTKSQVHILTGHTATISDVQCQESDPQVITGSMDSTVRCVPSLVLPNPSFEPTLTLARLPLPLPTACGTSQPARR